MESFKLKSSAMARRRSALQFAAPLSLLLLLIGINPSAHATISTTAGGASSGIRMPACVSVAENGDLFITDYENSAVGVRRASHGFLLSIHPLVFPLFSLASG